MTEKTFEQEMDYRIEHLKQAIKNSGEADTAWLEGQKSGFEYAAILYKEQHP